MPGSPALNSPYGLAFAVNCSILFQDLPILDRAAAARDNGFSAVEFWWPFGTAVPQAAEVDAFVDSIEAAEVQLIGLNSFAGDMPGGERGILSHPDRAGEFSDNLLVLREIGGRLACPAFNILYGNELPGLSPEEQMATAASNLLEAAAVLGEINGTALVEVVSGIPAYPLKTVASALGVVAEARNAGASNVAFLYDSFHIAANGEDPVAALRDSMADIGHVQIADFPGRGAPGTGQIDLPSIFGILADQRPQGWVALEHLASPDGSTFDWLASPAAAEHEQEN